MAGRPSTFTEEVALEICTRIAEGRSLRSICEDEEMPPLRTVMGWLSANETFQQQYARACDARADALFDEIIDIADDGRNDYYYVDEDGERVKKVDYDHIQRSKLRVDARKWAASKLKPKRYGDFSRTEVTGKDGGPLQFVNMTDAELDNAIAELESKLKDSQSGESQETGDSSRAESEESGV